MADREEKVVYRAVANFAQLRKEAAAAEKSLDKLAAKEKAVGEASETSEAKVRSARKSSSKASQQAAKDATTAEVAEKKLGETTVASEAKAAAARLSSAQAAKRASEENGKYSASANKAASAISKLSSESSAAAGGVDKLAKSNRAAALETERSAAAAEKLAKETERASASTKSADRSVGSYIRQILGLSRAARDGAEDVDRLGDSVGGIGGKGGGSSSFFSDFANNAKKATSALGGLVPALAQFAGLLAIGAAAQSLVAAVGALVPVALGAASALSSLAGAAGALPGGILAAVSAVGALTVALGPVGEALKAYQTQQGKTAAATTSNAAAEEAAAARIKSAKQQEADARLAAGRSAQDSARRIRDAVQAVASAEREAAAQRVQAANSVRQAEERLADANRDVRGAQEDLNDARKEALKDLKDLRQEAAGSAVDVESAQADLLKAQEEYNKALADPKASAADRAEALARVHQAQLGVTQAQEDAKTAQEELNDAEKKGVENSDKVKDAKTKLADSQRDARDAAIELKQAQKAQADSEIESNEKIRDAQEKLAEARVQASRDQADAARAILRAQENLVAAQKQAKTSSTSAAAATNVYTDALKKLSPSAQKVVRFLVAMAPAWEKVKKATQEAFFSHIVGDLDRIESLLPVVNDFLTTAADALGKTADQGIRMVSSGPWKRDFKTLAVSTGKVITSVGEGLLSLGDAARNIAVTAAPLTEGLASDFADVAEKIDDFITKARKSGDLSRFFNKSLDTLRQFGRIVVNIGKGFAGLIGASTDFGDSGVDAIEKLSEKFAAFGEAQKKAGSPFKKYLDDIKPLIKEEVRLVGALAKGIADIATDPKNIQHAVDLLQTLRTDILPKVLELLDNLSNSGFDTTFVAAIGDVLDLINTFLEGGGGEGLTTFAKTISVLAKGLEAVVSIPGVADGLGAIGGALGAIAAVALVGKFTGIFKLASAIQKIIKGEGPLKRILGLVRGGADDTTDVEVPTKETSKKATPRAKRSRTRNKRTTGVTFDQLLTGGDSSAERTRAKKGVPRRARMSTSFEATPGAAKVPRKAGNLRAGAGKSKVGKLGKAGKGLRGGAGAAGAAGLAAGVGGALIQDGNGGARDAAGGALSGAATGASIGAAVGSIVPGLGTALGAAIGGLAGALLGAWQAVGTDTIVGFATGALKKLKEIGGNIAGWFNDNVVKPVKKFFGIASPSKLFMEIGGFLIEGLKQGFLAALGGLFTVIGNTFSTAWATVKGLFTTAFSAIKEVFDFTTLTALFQAGWESIKMIFDVQLNLAKKIVSTVWAGIKLLFSKGFDALKKSSRAAWDVIKRLFKAPFEATKTALTTIWTTIKKLFSNSFNALKDVTKAAWQNIRDRFSNSWKSVKEVTANAWKSIRERFSNSFASVKTTVKDAWQNIRDRFSNSWKSIKDGVSSAFESIRTRFTNNLNKIKTAVSKAVSAVGKTWSGLKEKLQPPVGYFVNTIMGKWVVGNLNKVLGFLKLEKLPVPSVKFARGGTVPGTGSGDTVPAMLTPGEFVIRKKAVEKIGVSNLKQLNYADKGGYNSGGEIGPTKDGRRHFAFGGLVDDIGGLLSGIKDAGAGLVKNVREKGAGPALEIALKPVRAVVNQLGKSGINGIFNGGANKAMDGAVSFVKGKDAAVTGGVAVGGAPANVSGNQAIVKNLAAQLYNWVGSQWNSLYALVMGESGFRNTAQNPTSTAYGMFQFLDSTWAGVGATKTSDPAGQTRAGLKYISRSYGSPSNAYSKWYNRNPHWYAAGGPVDSVTPGSAQFKGDKLKKIPSYAPGFNFGGVVPQSPTYSYPGASRTLSAAAQSVTNNSGFNVDTININNPRQEKSGDSLYRTVSKMTLFGSQG